MHRLVDDLIDEILRFTWSSNPTVSTAAGIHDHDHRLIDCAPDAIDARLKATSAYRRELASLEQSLHPLPPADALDVGVLLDSLASEERLLEEVRAPFRDPAYYLDEILYGVYYLIEREFAPLPDRVRAAAARFAIGRGLFGFLLRTQHGIDMDADALHEFGLHLVTRSQENLVEAARAIDPHRSWQDLVAEWKSDHPEADDFLVEYRREVE